MTNLLRIEYMCSKCGLRIMRGAIDGKPLPGSCPRNGGSGRNVWIINRRFYKAGCEPEHDYHNIEYICRHSEICQTRGDENGKPEPGKCPKWTSDQPHNWIVNRKW